MSWDNQNLIKVLRGGGVAVMPTDTIYGVCASALDKEAVERVYKLKNRSPDKPCIILISDIEDIKNFNINLSTEQKKTLEKYWPGPVSIVLDTLAFRMPAPEPLRKLLKETGPLIVPSANTEGQPPARNIEEAKKYFGDAVDTYVDGGEIEGYPSKIIKLHKNGTAEILRD